MNLRAPPEPWCLAHSIKKASVWAQLAIVDSVRRRAFDVFFLSTSFSEAACDSSRQVGHGIPRGPHQEDTALVEDAPFKLRSCASYMLEELICLFRVSLQPFRLVIASYNEGIDIRIPRWSSGIYPEAPWNSTSTSEAVVTRQAGSEPDSEPESPPATGVTIWRTIWRWCRCVSIRIDDGNEPSRSIESCIYVGRRKSELIDRWWWIDRWIISWSLWGDASVFSLITSLWLIAADCLNI